MRLLISAALLLSLISSPALAEKWTDSSGQYTVEADFISFENGFVKLKLSSGKVVDVPLDKLNAAAKKRRSSVFRSIQHSYEVFLQRMTTLTVDSYGIMLLIRRHQRTK